MGKHAAEITIFAALVGFVLVVGLVAARWRRPDSMLDLEEWGLGGRSFGNGVTWFLLGGDIYTAYTIVALPALIYGVGAVGFFAVPFAAVVYPLVYVLLTRLWSVSHVHGFVTPADFVRARFGSRALATLVAVAAIVATMPYIALQLIGMEVVLKTLGVPTEWPLVVAFVLLALATFRSGLRGPALIAIVKDLLLLWTVLAALLYVATIPGYWSGIFRHARATFEQTPSLNDGLLLAPSNQLGYVTLLLGSALALFLYPHALTGVLAARNRGTVQRNLAALPVYTLLLGATGLLGYLASYLNVRPIGGDRNTIVPALFDTIFPAWCAGIGYAAIGIGALVPAAIMSIAAANLFTRNIYREYIRPSASPAQQTRVSQVASLAVKLGAVGAILVLNPQFAIDLQLIGGVIILQILPAVAVGLYTRWLHRYALVLGLVIGLLTGLLLLYQIPQPGPGGTTIRAHFGGSSWPLTNIGFDTTATIYAGLVALAVNLVVAVITTPIFRRRVPDAPDTTAPHHYFTDDTDPTIQRMESLVDGT